jgi:hypothetical protein
MGVAELLGLIAGILKFWDSVVWLVKVLRDSPEEKREEIMARIRGEADKLEKTGRPTWD